MSELISEYFTCKICTQNYASETSEEKPTVCNGCWLQMEPWQRYDDSDLNGV